MKRLFLLLIAVLMLFTACDPAASACQTHTDGDNNGTCDVCDTVVIVSFDIYAINDLHGKVADSATQVGVDELSAYLKTAQTQGNTILLSVGDMWQGSAESNMTKGLLTTDWMNRMDFAAMTMGNHEYDWGEAPIEENDALAEFPFLAINIYDVQTDARVEYCEPSVVVEADGVQLGIIGAIGDCYSSISSDKVQDVYFKTGRELTELVKAEAQRLRAEGVDFIIYALHDGYGSSKGDSVTSVAGNQLSSYYDQSLSDGYVDLVFEGHTHQNYLLRDAYGVYHLQNGGDNSKGICYAAITINIANGITNVTQTKLISTSQYANLADDPMVQELLDKYEEQIAPAYRVVGTNSAYRSRDALRQTVADLYYQAGLEKWGEEYDIVLGGGFISVRSPGYLSTGQVTYATLQTLFPFDNELVLCRVQGRDLQRNFFETSNSNYFLGYGDYGKQIKNDIDPNGTYYIVTDTYSSFYAPNRLEVVAEYGDGIFARDLLADYITAGGLG